MTNTDPTPTEIANMRVRLAVRLTEHEIRVRPDLDEKQRNRLARKLEIPDLRYRLDESGRYLSALIQVNQSLGADETAALLRTWVTETISAQIESINPYD